MSRPKKQVKLTQTAVIYARFSPRPDEKMVNCTSIEVQIDECRKWCKEHRYSIRSFHTDEGVSGRQSWEKRGGLAEAIAALEPGDVLLVHKLDRLSRDFMGAETIRVVVEQKHCEIRSASGEGTEDTGPEAELFRRLMQAIAEYQRKVTSIRSSLAARRRIANGGMVGVKPPYGWKADPDHKGRMLPDAAELYIIKRIFDMRITDGLSFDQIAWKLTVEGLRPRRAKKWYPTQIRRIFNANEKEWTI